MSVSEVQMEIDTVWRRDHRKERETYILEEGETGFSFSFVFEKVKHGGHASGKRGALFGKC